MLQHVEQGQMFKNITTIAEGRLHVGPTLAKSIIEQNSYELQRPIQRHHVLLLAHMMKNGGWNEGSQLAFARINKRLILVNGYHRLSAIILSELTQEFQVLIVDVEDMDAVGTLYARFDTGTRKRTNAEIFSAMSFSEKYGIGKNVANRLIRAATILENGFHRAHYTEKPEIQDVDYKIAISAKWAKPAILFQDLIKGAAPFLKDRLLSAGIMAVALATLVHQQGKAVPFWKGIAEDDGLRVGDPRKALARDLLTRNLHSGNRRQAEVSASTAWNAWYSNRSLKLVKFYGENAKFSILGTPWK